MSLVPHGWRRFRASYLVVSTFGAWALAASGQTLAPVLRAVQKRHIAVAQHDRVFNPALGAPVLIEWQTGGSNPPTLAPLPTDSSLASLTFERKVRLLELASEHFTRLRGKFLNVDKILGLGDPANPVPSASTPGFWEVYTEDDLPDLEVVNQDNYHQSLIALAQRVSKLRALFWPGEPRGPMRHDGDPQMAYYYQYTGDSVVKFPFPFATRPPAPAFYTVNTNDGEPGPVFTSRAARIIDGQPYSTLVRYRHVVDVPPEVSPPYLFESRKQVAVDPEAIPAAPFTHHRFDSALDSGYATGLLVRKNPLNTSGSLVQLPQGLSWLALNFQGWIADDRFPQEPNSPRTTWWSLSLPAAAAGSEPGTLTFGNINVPTNGVWPAAWSFSAGVGAPPAPSNVAIPGTWTVTDYNSGAIVESVADFAVHDPVFAFERRVVLVAHPQFGDEELTLASPRWDRSGQRAGNLSVGLSSILAEIDLGLGIGDDAQAGRLIVTVPTAAAPWGFDGMKFAGCRSDFLFQYDEPPTRFFPDVPPSQVTAEMESAAAQAGWFNFAAYHNAWDTMRIKEVRGSQMAAQFTRTDDFHCSISLRPLLNGVLQAVVKTVIISNGSAHGSFPSERQWVRIVETDGAGGPGREWDIRVLPPPASYTSWTTINVRATGADQPEEELSYLGITHVRDGSDPATYRRLFYKRPRLEDGTLGGVLPLVSDEDLDIDPPLVRSREFLPRRRKEYDVTGGPFPFRETLATYRTFGSLLASPWTYPGLPLRTLDTISCRGPAWALDGAELKFDANGRMISQKNSFNADYDSVILRGSDATNSHKLFDESWFRKKSNGALSLFRRSVREFTADLASFTDKVNGTASSVELEQSVVLSGGNVTTPGELPWRKKLITRSNGSEVRFSYHKASDSLTFVSFEGPPGGSKGIADIVQTNQSGSVVLHRQLNPTAAFNQGAIPAGPIIWSMAAAGGTDSFGQPGQYLFADGSTTTVQTIASGSFAGAIESIIGRDSRQNTMRRGLDGSVFSSNETGGPSWLMSGDGQTTRFTCSTVGTGGPQSLFARRDALGNLVEAESTFGTGAKFLRVGALSATLTSETAPGVGGNRTVATSFAADGSQTAVAAGAGSPSLNQSRAPVQVGPAWLLALTESQAGAAGPATISYFDHRGRLVRQDISHPDGSGGMVSSTYAYPTNKRIVVTPPAGSVRPGRIFELLSDYETVEMRDNNSSGTNKSWIKRSWVGSELVETTTVQDDSGGGGTISRIICENRTSAATGTQFVKPWGSAVLQATIVRRYPGHAGPPTPGDTSVTTTVAGPYGQGEIKTLAAQPTSVRQWLHDGALTSTTLDLNGLRNVTKVTTTQPGLSSALLTEFDATGRMTRMKGPDLDAAVTHNYNGGGVRVTASAANLPQSIVLGEDAEGFLSRLQAYGEDDADLVTTHAGVNTSINLTPDQGAAVSYTIGPWGHPKGRQFISGTGYSAAWKVDGSLQSATLPGPGSPASFTVTYANEGTRRTLLWNDGYSVTADEYRIGLPKSLSDSIDASTFTWDYFQLKAEQHGSGSAGLNGYKVERKYDPQHRFIGTRLMQGSTLLSETTLTYDATSRMSTFNAGPSGTWLSGSYGYRAGTAVVGTLSRSGVVTTLLPEPGRLRLWSISTTASPQPFTTHYAYNPQGLISTEASSQKPAVDFFYDDDGRLINVADGTPNIPDDDPGPYAFAGTWSVQGNPLHAGFAPANPLNQLTSKSNSQLCVLSGQADPAAAIRLWMEAALYPNPDHAVSLAITANGLFYATWGPAPGTGWRRIPIVVEARVEGAGDNGAAAVAIANYTVLVPPATANLIHDSAGNRKSDSKHTYTWDPRGRLTQVSRLSDYAAVAGGTMTTTFLHDAQGRRVKKTAVETITVAGAPTTRTTVTKWVYDGWLPVMEETQVNGGTAKRKFYQWGLDISHTLGGAGGVGGLLAIRDASTNKTYLPVTDGRGNIVALVDAAGTHPTVAQWTYDAWGNTVSSNGNTALCPFGWQSKYRDPETNLIDFGYRTYDPESRRWLSREPLGEAASMNLYSYCHEDPINRFDYLGKFDLPNHAELTSNGLVAQKKPLGLPEEDFDELLRGMLQGVLYPDIQVRFPLAKGLTPAEHVETIRKYFHAKRYLPKKVQQLGKALDHGIDFLQHEGADVIMPGSTETRQGLVNWYKHTPPLYWKGLNWYHEKAPEPLTAAWAGNLYGSHMGPESWQHFMSSGTQTAEYIRSKVIENTLANFQEFCRHKAAGDYLEAGFHLGKSLHYLQDSYSESHVHRTPLGLILHVRDYSKQSAVYHAQADDPGRDSLSYKGALLQTNRMAALYLQGSITTDTVGAFYRLAPNADSGRPGRNFRLPDNTVDPLEYMKHLNNALPSSYRLPDNILDNPLNHLNNALPSFLRVPE